MINKAAILLHIGIVSAVVGARAAQTINVDFDHGTTYSGTAIAPDLGTVWNGMSLTERPVSKLIEDVSDSFGNTIPGVDVSLASADGTSQINRYNDASNHTPNPVDLMADYSYGTTFNVTVSGLPVGRSYRLYAYLCGNNIGQGGGLSVAAANGGSGLGSFTYVTATDAGFRDIYSANGEGAGYLVRDTIVDGSGEIRLQVDSYLNGFQLAEIGNESPSIEGLEDQTVTVGANTILNPSVFGSTPINYQWSSNGIALPGEIDATLVLTNVQASQSGTIYSLAVTNAYGADTNDMLLTVFNGPSGFCMENGTTTGGEGGPVVTVDNGTDFISQIGMAGPRIIQVRGVISIGQASVAANKTIVGLGTDATLLGRLRVDSGTTNVIVQNLRVSHPGDDGITIRDSGTSHVWIDHVTFFDCGDGACDISAGADYVTVSWCKFIYPTQEEHQFTMIADGPKDGGPLTAHITLHNNWWSSGSNQRMAATSDALVHYYNNYFDCIGNSYCSNARDDAQLLIENSYYSGVKNPVELSSGSSGKISTSGNLYRGCLGTIHPGTDNVFTPPYAYTLDAVVDVPALVQSGAGASGPDTVVIPPKVWDGGGANNNLSTSGNWALGETPRAYDVMTFSGSTRLSPYNNFAGGTEFQLVTFSDDAGPFTLDGNTLNLGIGIQNDSADSQNINLDLDFAYASDHFAMNREFNVSDINGSLIINGDISGAAPDYNKSYTVVKTGPGLLTLNGANSFYGTFKFEDGLVRFSSAANLGTSNLVFDGGGLQWTDGNVTDVSGTPVEILSGGAIFDVGVNEVDFASPVGVGGIGGLTKAGAGTLTLHGSNAYSGETFISAGTLALGASGGIPNSPQIILTNNAVLDVTGRSNGTLSLGSGQSLVGNGNVLGSVTVSSGAEASPGFSVGTLIVGDVLTFQPGSTTTMELDTSLTASNDLFSGMSFVTYGGSLAVSNLGPALEDGDAFKLFDATGYSGSFNSISLPLLDGDLVWTNTLATDGTIAVVSSAPPVNITPTNIVFSVSGTGTNQMLMFSWPVDHTGWVLDAQTNGLSTNWFPIPGSHLTNEITIPLFPDADSAFFRMRYP